MLFVQKWGENKHLQLIPMCWLAQKRWLAPYKTGEYMFLDTEVIFKNVKNTYTKVTQHSFPH